MNVNNMCMLTKSLFCDNLRVIDGNLCLKQKHSVRVTSVDYNSSAQSAYNSSLSLVDIICATHNS